MRSLVAIVAVTAVFAGTLVGGLSYTGALDPELLQGANDDSAREATAGWKTHSVPKEGFALQLPPRWLGGPNGLARAQVERLWSGRPALPRAFRPKQFVPPVAPVKFFAFDVSASSLANARRELGITNVNVVREAAKADADALFDSAVRDTAAKSNLIGAVRDDHVRLAAGKALRLRFEVQSQTAGLPIVLSQTQYGVVADRSLYVMTFTTTRRQAALYLRVFERIAMSFRPLAPSKTT
jgi:hypothetical protein